LDNCKEKLTVAIAAATISAASTTATTTTAATATSAVTTAAATTASAAVTATAATSASAATFTLWASFVDYQCAAEEILAVESGDDLFGFGVVANFSETEAAWLPRETVAK
jgi:hypothetical protein